MGELQELNNGAVNAIKGYRRQFLYTLHRLLNNDDDDLIFEPEGYFEDLDIKDRKGNVIETVQVKNTSGTLVFSDLFSKKDSFYKRAKKATSLNVKKIKLVCFGNLSDELQDKTLQKVSKKLIKKGLKESQIKSIASKYNFEITTEESLQQAIISNIEKFESFIDPFVTLDLLLFWIYKVAEQRVPITIKDFTTQLNQIGKYTSERIDFHNTFGNTIKPLETKDFAEDNIDQYKKGFYFGVSAKYEHILADVDVKREKWLQEIKASFKNNNVVFIHGASGQGKSTLAYRYLKDSQSQYANYELKLTENYLDVLNTINSLESLCKGLSFPIVLYIDVTSQYTYWQEVIKELYDKKNIHFLITIRQEDWNKLSIDHLFDFKDIELCIDKEEAQKIYDNFSEYKPDLKFITFEESWGKIGENSPLLEYIYFLTQGKTLESRLKEQLWKIQEKVESKKTQDIEILRFVSLADSLNARINYKSLVTSLKINNPKLYIDYFEKEYLLQLSTDKCFLTGLHPVRSQIISNLLFDDSGFVDKNEYIKKALSLIHEDDIHIFLLTAFDSGFDINDCLSALSSLQLNSWSGNNNVLKALWWKGVFDYVTKENRTVLNEFYSTYSDAWSIFFNPLLSDSEKEDSLFSLFNIFHKDDKQQEIAKKNYKDLNNKLTPIDNCNQYCIHWLANYSNFPEISKNDKDLNEFGEFLFRLTLLDIDPIEVRIDSGKLCHFFNSADSIDSMATVLLGLKEYGLSDSIDISTLESVFINKLRNQYNITTLEINEVKILTYYFFDIIGFESEESIANPFHNRTLEIQNIVRKAFPDKQEYEIKGLGHNFLELENMPDDTYKCMPKKNLPVSMETEKIRLAINLHDNTKRLKAWQEYVDLLVHNRTVIINALIALKKGLVTYFKNNEKGIQYLIDNEIPIKESISSLSHALPLCAVDKWGYKGEDTAFKIDISGSKQTEKNLSHQKFDTLLKTRSEYFSSLQNFINQSFKAINDKISTINDPSYKVTDENFYNVTEVNLFNSAYNLLSFQEQFEKYFKKFTDTTELKQLSKREVNATVELMSLWKQFLYSPYRINKQVSRKANLTFELTKNQLLQKIYGEIIKIAKQTGLVIKLNTDHYDKRLIMFVETSADLYLESVGTCVDVAITVFSNMHHSSLKSLLTKLNFDTISIIPLFHSHPLNNKYLEIPLFRIDRVKEILCSGQKDVNLFEIFKFPADINKRILNKERLIPWNSRIDGIQNYEQCMAIVLGLKFVCQEYIKLLDYFSSVDSIGIDLLSKYKLKIINHFHEANSENKIDINSYNIPTSLSCQIKENMSRLTDHLDNLSQNELMNFDLDLIGKSASVLESEYLNFSEIMIANYLENTPA